MFVHSSRFQNNSTYIVWFSVLHSMYLFIECNYNNFHTWDKFDIAECVRVLRSHTAYVPNNGKKQGLFIHLVWNKTVICCRINLKS